jgi:hypothetical protein
MGASGSEVGNDRPFGLANSAGTCPCEWASRQHLEDATLRLNVAPSFEKNLVFSRRKPARLKCSALRHEPSSPF